MPFEQDLCPLGLLGLHKIQVIMNPKTYQELDGVKINECLHQNGRYFSAMINGGFPPPVHVKLETFSVREETVFLHTRLVSSEV